MGLFNKMTENSNHMIISDLTYPLYCDYVLESPFKPRDVIPLSVSVNKLGWRF